MGAVWCAEHLELRAPVALKLIEATGSNHPENARQFLHEARMAAGLQSQHVVRIFDYGLAEDTPFIAMELLEGETLRRRLDRQGALGLAEVQRIVRHVARGVEGAHRAQVIHRDLKPENVFISTGEEQEVIKVLDFGLAKSVSSLSTSISPATPTGAVLGTPHYMSPEQARGAKGVDQRTDLWSLGVVAFECLLGRVPFSGDTLGDLIVAVCSEPLPVPSQRGAVPAGFDAWFARACAREPAARFASARELAEAFDALPEAARALDTDISESLAASPAPRAQSSLGTPPHSVQALDGASKPRSVLRWRLSGVVLLLAVLVGGVAFLLNALRPMRRTSVVAPSLQAAPPGVPLPSQQDPVLRELPPERPTFPSAAAERAAKPAADATGRTTPATTRAERLPAKKKSRAPTVDLGF
jgi:serine/threonine-protein kinase